MSYAERYLEYIRVEKRYSLRTIEIYRTAIDEYYAFCNKVDDESELTLLNYRNIRGFVASNLENGISSRTMNLKLSAISSFCTYLLKAGLISSNPAKQVRRPKQEKRLPDFFTTDAIQSYFSELPESVDFIAIRDRMVVILLYSTGIRRAELASLKIGDIDFSRAVLKVTGKGDKMREVPLTTELMVILKRYLSDFRENYPVNDENYLFLTDSGQHFYLSFVNKVVGKELNKFPEFKGKKSPHKLRHSIATHLLNNGADLNSIKEILGHSSLAATQVYTHNSFEQLKKVFITAHPRAKKGG